jgi:hypothetical protein
MHNNVEKYGVNSDEDDIIKTSKVVKKDKLEEVLINNITKQINKIESIALTRANEGINRNKNNNDDRTKNDDRNKPSNGNKRHINTYKICNPQIGNIKANKKYVGLIFVNNDKKSSFITLTKNVYIINYYITIMINDKSDEKINNYFCSLGIKNNDVNKISIIKGSKNFINIKNNLHSEFIIIKDTIIYEAPTNQEICLITDFNKKCKIVEDKSIIKIVLL